MKIKSFFFAIIGLLVPVLFFTGCTPPSTTTNPTGPGNNLTQPPVVILNDTLYIYFGQPTLKANPFLTTSNGTVITQIRGTYFTQQGGSTLTNLACMGIDSLTPMQSYDYRIAIPLNNYTSPGSNLQVNLISPIGPGSQSTSSTK